MNEKLMDLLSNTTGDKVSETHVTVTPDMVASADQVWEQVRVFPLTSGWISLTDKVIPLYSAADLADVQGGIILSGELSAGSESLHIRQAETGWSITRIKTGEGEKEKCLMLREEYIGTENKQQDRLQYEVYWKLENGTYRPWVARFAGMLNVGGA